MTFTVRQASINDLSFLTQSLLTMAKESEGVALDVELLQEGITQVFMTSDADGEIPEIVIQGQYWVVADDETKQPVGMCMITSEWSDWYATYYWWIQSVYILPEYRGQGLVKALFERLADEAKKQGVRELRLYVEKNNAPAIRAYEKVGFEGDHYRVMTKCL